MDIKVAPFQKFLVSVLIFIILSMVTVCMLLVWPSALITNLLILVLVLIGISVGKYIITSL